MLGDVGIKLLKRPPLTRPHVAHLLVQVVYIHKAHLLTQSLSGGPRLILEIRVTITQLYSKLPNQFPQGLDDGSPYRGTFLGGGREQARALQVFRS